MKEEELIKKFKEYEYFLIKVLNPIDKENFKIKFDGKKEFNHIKKIIDKIYFNEVTEFNNLNLNFDDNFIYLTLKGGKKWKKKD